MREKGKERRFKTACGKKKGVVSPGGWRVAGSWWPRTCRRDSTSQRSMLSYAAFCTRDAGWLAPPRLLPGGAGCRLYAARMCYNCFWRCRPRMEKIGGLGRVICAWQMLHRFAFAQP